MLSDKLIQESDCMQTGFYVSTKFLKQTLAIQVHHTFKWKRGPTLDSHLASSRPAGSAGGVIMHILYLQPPVDRHQKCQACGVISSSLMVSAVTPNHNWLVFRGI